MDAFYKTIDSQIVSKPYLIIDVRNNGGGSEANYFKLIKYLYTDPIYPDVFQYFSTPENLARYKESVGMMKSDSGRYGSGTIKSYEVMIQRMESAKPYTFLERPQQSAITQSYISATPKRIIILANRACASSCEAFIYNASQSKKVQVMGENTGGFIGYGNVMPFKTPCFAYSFQSTTTKYANLYKYEFVGIPPDIRLKSSIDWVRAAVEALEK